MKKGPVAPFLNCLICLARPERFERPTPWFVACKAEIAGCKFNNLGATVRCLLHNKASQSTTELGKYGANVAPVMGSSKISTADFRSVAEFIGNS